MNRDDLIAVFLARNGYAPGDAAPLAQDAGFRRYLRIGGDRPAVLMDAPPPEDVRPFLRIAAHLRGIGLAVPAIFAADEARGLILEEDLGDDLLSVLLDRGDAPDPLLDAAVDALVVMQRAAPPDGLPAWDAAAMASTALGTLFDWWWPACFGTPPPRPRETTWRRRWQPCWNRSPADRAASSIATISPATSLRLPDHRIGDHRLPGRRDRPSGLRSGVPAAGRPPRHPAGLAAIVPWTLSGGAAGTGLRKIQGRVHRVRGAAASSCRLPVGKACPARGPAPIPRLWTANVAPAGGRLVATSRRTARDRLEPLDTAFQTRQPTRTA